MAFVGYNCVHCPCSPTTGQYPQGRYYKPEGDDGTYSDTDWDQCEFSAVKYLESGKKKVASGKTFDEAIEVKSSSKYMEVEGDVDECKPSARNNNNSEATFVMVENDDMDMSSVTTYVTDQNDSAPIAKMKVSMIIC